MITPPYSASILPGITRHTAIQLAKEMGIKVLERNLPRELLYVADEVFFTGSAAEITPVRSVDRIVVGSGKAGPIAKRLQAAFADIIENGNDKRGWLRRVYSHETVGV